MLRLSAMAFEHLITPPDAGFASASRQVWDERPDLQEAFPDAQGQGMLKWLGVNGILEYPERIGCFYPPVPPEELRHTACGGLTEHSHLYTSVEDFQTLIQLFETFSGRPGESLESVLDFGSGCGRILRWFPLALPRLASFGAEVRAASVHWCRDNLRGTFLNNETQPPLDLPDDSVELVVSLSVFSHLNLESNRAWIRELVRVCKPGGMLLLSTHGAFSLAVTARSPDHQSGLQLSPDEARRYLRDLEGESFLYHKAPADLVAKLEGPEADYGQAFFTDRFVREEWGELVDVLGYVPVALNLIQDFFVLRPRK